MKSQFNNYFLVPAQVSSAVRLVPEGCDSKQKCQAPLITQLLIRTTALLLNTAIACNKRTQNECINRIFSGCRVLLECYSNSSWRTDHKC